jgi:hypothetical protein
MAKNKKDPYDLAGRLLEAFGIALSGTATGRLLTAVAQDDHAGFHAALKEGANPNTGAGAPLQLAAVQDNPLMMRWLVTAGADIAYAVKSLKEQRNGIKRSKSYDGYWDNYTYTYKNKEDEQRYKALTAAIGTLEKFAKTYKEDIAQLEAVRLQSETLMALHALKAEVTEAVHGRPLDKKPLPAPAALNRPAPERAGPKGKDSP